MEIVISFPGGGGVDAHIGNFTLKTDQHPPIGNSSAPTPFEMFIASIGTCAGSTILSFCQQREIPVEGIGLKVRTVDDSETGMVNQVLVDIQIPPDFPAKYKRVLVLVAEQCLVKKHLEQATRVLVTASEKASDEKVAEPTVRS